MGLPDLLELRGKFAVAHAALLQLYQAGALLRGKIP
jgi:hypothetical protein